MPTLLTFASILASFVITFLFLPKWIKRARSRGFTGKDVHKPGKPPVAELGGMVVVFGALIGILAYVATQVFTYRNYQSMAFILAATTAIAIAAIIGLLDDILGWKIGIRQRHKPFLSLLIALPIMVVNAGEPAITLPLFGQVELGWIFPLLVIPAAIVGAANGFNMLAGLNGLEAGMGAIVVGTLGFIAWQSHAIAAAVIAACTLAALLAFLLFNWYPARVFPGNVMTYTVGATLAVVAIIGNIEKYALILFLPYFAELILKARGGFQQESFAKYYDSGLVNRTKKWYSLNHAAIDLLRRLRGKATEEGAVLLILGLELVLAAVAVTAFFL